MFIFFIANLRIHHHETLRLEMNESLKISCRFVWNGCFYVNGPSFSVYLIFISNVFKRATLIWICSGFIYTLKEIVPYKMFENKTFRTLLNNWFPSIIQRMCSKKTVQVQSFRSTFKEWPFGFLVRYVALRGLNRNDIWICVDAGTSSSVVSCYGEWTYGANWKLKSFLSIEHAGRKSLCWLFCILFAFRLPQRGYGTEAETECMWLMCDKKTHILLHLSIKLLKRDSSNISYTKFS